MGLRLCQAQSCAGRSRTGATEAVREGTGAAGELWQEGPLQGDSCPSWLCWRGLWQQVMGLFSLAEAMGVPGAMSSQRISHEKRCLRCQTQGCGRGAWSQLIPSSNTLSYRLLSAGPEAPWLWGIAWLQGSYVNVLLWGLALVQKTVSLLLV